MSATDSVFAVVSISACCWRPFTKGPLVPDVLTIAGFTAFAEDVPGSVGFSSVAFIRAVVGVTAAVAGVPDVDGVFGVASFPADLSDYRISHSQITIGCPPLLI